MLWIKSFHIIFVASWFAGLFYLPRLFVNLASIEAKDSPEYLRLLGMSQRLLRFMTILAIPAVVLGVWLWLGYGFGAGAYWLHGKLAVVGLVLAYHGYCAVLLRAFEQGRNRHSHVWYRWYNELPVLLMTFAVILVVVKPF